MLVSIGIGPLAASVENVKLLEVVDPLDPLTEVTAKL